jgi:NADPH:quinone reductase-like Zn-dependent oxidoreductase
MGIIEASKGGFGLEASGTVLKVGTAVSDFHVGDKVIVFKSGCLATKMHVSSLLCARIPEDLNDLDAATMPTVYSTVIHSLINLGNMQKGQGTSVLIHSACGGVGLAAIHLCKALGASVRDSSILS